MTDGIGEIDLAELAALKARMTASRQRPSSVGDRRASEAAAQRAMDGRISTTSKPSKKAGHVQLNARVTPDVKNRVIELSRAEGSDMSSVVEAALLAYFKSKGL